MAKITALTELARADVQGTDYLVVVDESAAVTKKLEVQSLLGALDGDQLDIDFTPTYYTPASTPAEADDADDLSAHLYGIDQKLGEIDLVATEQADTTFTVSSTDHYIEINTSGNPVTATLPSAATLGQGWRYTLKVTDPTNAVTVATNGAETIDGIAGYSMCTNGEVLEIISDGTNWKVLRHETNRPYHRPQFTYATSTSFTIGTFTMKVPTLGINAFVKAAVTCYGSSGGGGSNANNTDLDTTGWWYVYIDASAVTSNLLTAAMFLLSTDEPDFDSNYGVWVGDATSNTTTSDVCIFGFRVSAASQIFKWWHAGKDYVQMDAPIENHGTSLNTTWEAVTVSKPAFAYEADLLVYAYTDGGGNNTGFRVMYRPGASTGSGTIVAWGRNKPVDGTYICHNANNLRAIVSNGTADFQGNADSEDANELASIKTMGYYLPKGM